MKISKKIFLAALFLASLAKPASFSENLNDSKIAIDILNQFELITKRINNKLDDENLFLNGLLDIYLILEFHKSSIDPKNKELNNLISKMLSKAKRKSNSENFVQFKEQIEQLDKIYEERKVKKISKANLNFYPDFEMFTKHIDDEMKSEATFISSLMDIYLALEHEVVKDLSGARKEILSKMKSAYKASKAYGFDFYKEYLLEVVNKAIEMQSRNGSLVWPEREINRVELENLRKKIVEKNDPIIPKAKLEQPKELVQTKQNISESKNEKTEEKKTLKKSSLKPSQPKRQRKTKAPRLSRKTPSPKKKTETAKKEKKEKIPKQKTENILIQKPTANETENLEAAAPNQKTQTSNKKIRVREKKQKAEIPKKPKPKTSKLSRSKAS